MMKQSSSAQSIVPGGALAEFPLEQAEVDPRWRLAESVVAGSHFVRSPLLSRFLLFVVSETIEGRHAAITEHNIGVTVFGRPASYRTDEDNIVRNYARQLRKRLAEHFAGEGRGEPMRIEIPTGGYVPVFPIMDPPNDSQDVNGEPQSGDAQALWKYQVAAQHRGVSAAKRWILHAALVGFGALTIPCLQWLYGHVSLRGTADPARSFWMAVLPPGRNTYIVPADAGLNLIEDTAQRAVPLASYIRGAYDSVGTQGLETLKGHTLRDLHAEEYTDFVSTQIVTALTRQPGYDSQRVLLRFPRDLRLDDLKRANAIIIGSSTANPWASLGESETNFRIVPSQNMESASIVNSRPLPGELKAYESHWNEPAHETYALIQFLPNLSGSGHLLFLQGLDVAGTQAAAEFLLHPESMAPWLRRARQPDGTFRPFEVLLRATSIQSNAEGTTVLASRIR